ncbi:MAG: hypothetical protein AB7K09_01695 [Planctomycetota bacterium]
MLLIADRTAFAEQRDVVARVRYLSAEMVYLDQGSGAGIRAGDVGTIMRDNAAIARIRVVTVSSDSAAAEVEEQFGDIAPAVGDTVNVSVSTPAPKPDDGVQLKVPEGLPAPPVVPDGSGSSDTGEPQPFVPLLAPRQAKATSREWIIKGNVRADVLWTQDWFATHDTFLTFRLSSRGTIDRAFGEPIRFQWDLTSDLNTANGNVGSDDYNRIELHVSELLAQWFIEPHTALTVGRMQPTTLPALGRLDGGSFEWSPTDEVRFGVIGGLRPDAANLDVDSRDEAVAVYGSGKYKSDDVQFYLALGALMSWFQQAADRRAGYADMRVTVSKVLTVYASSEFDLYGASDTFRGGGGIGVTRSSISLRATAGIVGFRALFSQSQLPDTKAQRQITSDPTLYNDGTLRFLFAVNEKVDSFIFEQEFTWWTGTGSSTDWQAALQIRDLHAFDSHLYFTLRLSWRDGKDTGRRAAQMDFIWQPDEEWSIRLSFVFAMVLPENSQGVTDLFEQTATADLAWMISESVTGALSLNLNFGDAVASSTINLSVTWRFP